MRTYTEDVWPAPPNPWPAPPNPLPKGQSRTHSWAEVAANITIGFAVSVALTAVVLPAFGHNITLQDNLAITTVFTVASLLRSYALRRIFNHITTGAQS